MYQGYGFEAHAVNLSEPLPPEQIDNYVKDCWDMIVETARWAEMDLPGVPGKVIDAVSRRSIPA